MTRTDGSSWGSGRPAAEGDNRMLGLPAQLGLTAEALARAGSVAALAGTVDERCATLQRRRDPLGLSYLVVGAELMDGPAPVVEHLSGG